MGYTRLDVPWPDEVTHVRLWDIRQENSLTIPSWDRLDEAVAKAGGRNITYVIGGTPQWAAKYPNNPHYAPWVG